ncbi:MAG: hypothetical protein EOO07_18335, partial [Chitinophagaceae bacterium]
MLQGTLIRFTSVVFLTFIISACGGGGGGGGSKSATSSIDSQGGNSPISSQNSSTSQSQPLNRINTPVFISSYLDVLSFAKETAATIVNGQYEIGLADGVYKNACEGGVGSVEFTVSGGGDVLVQKYKNCKLFVSSNGVTDTLLVSGEESVSTVRNENTFSLVKVTWKNYSLSINAAPSITLTGSFSYEGWLHFEPSVSYVNTTSKIKLDASINDGQKTVVVEAADFTFDFPSIFDRYDSVGGFFDFEPHGLHVFHNKIIAASGSIGIDNVKGNYALNSSTKRVTFSNLATPKSYLDVSAQGFYIRWDENKDGLMEANVFISESEYPDMSDHLLE